MYAKLYDFFFKFLCIACQMFEVTFSFYSYFLALSSVNLLDLSGRKKINKNVKLDLNKIFKANNVKKVKV